MIVFSHVGEQTLIETRMGGLLDGLPAWEATTVLIRIERQAGGEAGGLSEKLGALGVRREHLPALADDAAGQWTGRFNPRPFDRAGALEVYECAY